VIKKFCEVTAAALRPNDVFGGMGGEEFAVVLPGRKSVGTNHPVPAREAATIFARRDPRRARLWHHVTKF
jgi:GGDEF domain-containing protein